MEVTHLRYSSGQSSISTVWRQEQPRETIWANHKKENKRQEILIRQLNVLLGKTPASTPDGNIPHSRNCLKSLQPAFLPI